MPNIQPPPLLTYPQLAEIFGTTERHIQELVYRREIAFVKVGRLVRFRPEDVDAYTSARRVAEGAA